MIFFVPLSQIRTYYETKETKNQVFSNIPSLLVCLSGLSGGWSSEIPDIGGLLRLLRIGGGGIIADCPPPYPGGLQINKRT